MTNGEVLIRKKKTNGLTVVIILVAIATLAITFIASNEISKNYDKEQKRPAIKYNVGDARSPQRICRTCSGTKKIRGVKCWACDGKGFN